NVAAISSQSEEIGNLIADAMDKVGKDGVITVEDGQGVGTELETVEGMQFDRGYVSPYMVTNPDRMEAVLEEPFILITDRKISAVQDLLPVLEKVVQQGRPLLIVAEDIEGEAMATLIVNKLRGTFQAVAVKAPGFGDRRKAMLEDMAILTGGQVISEDLGLKLDQTRIEQLGRARRVTVTKDDTTIVEGAGKQNDIQGRIKAIQAQKALEKSLDLTGDQATGVAIVRRALEEPVRQIAANAGYEGSVIVESIRKAKPGEGWDALNGKQVDMVEAGIVDPAKVTRSA